jgi:DNA gyrase inhibitor GyrI
MSELEVRIVMLEPMHVASVHGFGESPEEKAWDKLMAWAKTKGLVNDLETHRIFGFNNPDPSPASPNYGYEFWMVVGPEVEPEGKVRIKEFAGGLYAVARCEVGGEPWETIPATWRRLGAWVEDSKYRWASHQWLEEHIGDVDRPEGLVLDLYFPIAK